MKSFLLERTLFDLFIRAHPLLRTVTMMSAITKALIVTVNRQKVNFRTDENCRGVKKLIFSENW